MANPRPRTDAREHVQQMVEQEFSEFMEFKILETPEEDNWISVTAVNKDTKKPLLHQTGNEKGQPIQSEYRQISGDPAYS